MVPTDRFAAILEALSDLDQLLGRENPIARIAPSVRLRIRMCKAEFVRREARWIAPHFLRPLAARRFVQYVARSGVIVYSHFLPEPAAQQRRRGHAQSFARKVP